MLIIKNNIDPPSEQRDALNKIEYLKDRITAARIRGNEEKVKELSRDLVKAEREYEERFGLKGSSNDT